MAVRTMRMLCTDGDKALAEWDTDNLTPQRLTQIEMEFNSKIQEGFFAADVGIQFKDSGGLLCGGCYGQSKRFDHEIRSKRANCADSTRARWLNAGAARRP
jgi:hypothetical protein